LKSIQEKVTLYRDSHRHLSGRVPHVITDQKPAHCGNRMIL